jgi:hypothetical protein
MESNTSNSDDTKVPLKPKSATRWRIFAWAAVLIAVVALIATFLLPGFPSENVSVEGKQLNGELIQLKMRSGNGHLQGHFRSWSPYQVSTDGTCLVRLSFSWGIGSESNSVVGHVSENGRVLTFSGSVPEPRNPESGKLSIAIVTNRAGRDTIIFNNPVQFVP